VVAPGALDAVVDDPAGLVVVDPAGAVVEVVVSTTVDAVGPVVGTTLVVGGEVVARGTAFGRVVVVGAAGVITTGAYTCLGVGAGRTRSYSTHTSTNATISAIVERRIRI
jgi:hypothetical protein